VRSAGENAGKNAGESAGEKRGVVDPLIIIIASILAAAVFFAGLFFIIAKGGEKAIEVGREKAGEAQQTASCAAQDGECKTYDQCAADKRIAPLDCPAQTICCRK